MTNQITDYILQNLAYIHDRELSVTDRDYDSITRLVVHITIPWNEDTVDCLCFLTVPRRYRTIKPLHQLVSILKRCCTDAP
jgi:hypothetical protein